MFLKKIFENNIISLEQKLEIEKNMKDQSFEEQIDHLITSGIVTKTDVLKALSELSDLKSCPHYQQKNWSLMMTPLC